MSVINRTEIIHFANRLKLRIMHFAHGTYPIDDNAAALPRNRFFMPETDGDSTCFISDAKDCFPLRAGYVCFIPAYHEARVCLNDRITFLSVQFRLELWEGLDIFSHTKSMQLIPEPVFFKRGMAAFRTENTLHSSLELMSLTMDFCNRALSNIPTEEIDLGTRFSNYQKEIEFLNRGIRADTTVESLADLHGVQRETFTRKFTEDTGITPKRFIARLLFNRASEMLLQTTLPVKVIAEELGFSTEYYFSGFFKKQSGLPPGRFRTQYR